MHGPGIVARFLSGTTTTDKWGNDWQYNSWSDNHSKVACWGLFFDLLTQSSLLRSHVRDGKVVFGVNHRLRDFATGRQKNLDLVIARPAAPVSGSPSSRSLADLGAQWNVPLTAAQQAELSALPMPEEGPIGAVLMALEAKACMTAHQKSLPRLYDELNSSHLTVHGASSQALAVGLVLVNASPTFVSPKQNNHPLAGTTPVVSTHPQPRYAEITLDKVKEIPRRSSNSSHGFDALACVVIDCKNDGRTPTGLVTGPPSPPAGDTYHYETAVTRIGNEYDATFKRI